MNNEDIEIVNLSGEDKKKINFDFKKYKLPIMIGVPSIILFIIIIVCILLFNKEDVVLINVIGKKEKIETTLDLKGIFKSDNNQYDTYKINNISKAIINNDKIYYSYSPNYCVYENEISCTDLEKEKKNCEDNKKLICKENNDNEVCEENYCENLYKDKKCVKNNNNLCSQYSKTDTDYKDLTNRYIMVSNLDGSKTKELIKHEKTEPLEFRYTNNSLALYYSNGDDTSYKLDLKEDKIIKIRDKYQIMSKPISNEQELAFINYKDDYYSLNFYNHEDLVRPT